MTDRSRHNRMMRPAAGVATAAVLGALYFAFEQPASEGLDDVILPESPTDTPSFPPDVVVPLIEAPDSTERAGNEVNNEENASESEAPASKGQNLEDVLFGKEEMLAYEHLMVRGERFPIINIEIKYNDPVREITEYTYEVLIPLWYDYEVWKGEVEEIRWMDWKVFFPKLVAPINFGDPEDPLEHDYSVYVDADEFGTHLEDYREKGLPAVPDLRYSIHGYETGDPEKSMSFEMPGVATGIMKWDFAGRRGYGTIKISHGSQE